MTRHYGKLGNVVELIRRSFICLIPKSNAYTESVIATLGSVSGYIQRQPHLYAPDRFNSGPPP